MSRYYNKRVLNNSSEYYAPLRKKRNAKIIRQSDTPILYNPGVMDRASVLSTTHIWKYGDRFYTMAQKYYGDVRYWWVIAWYNGAPTEAHMDPGDLIEITVNIEDALKVLGVA